MYHITEYTYRRAQEWGLTVKPSINPKKKIDVFKNGRKVGSIGAIGYGDYPTFIKTKGKAYADERRRLYHIRHTQPSIGEQLALHLLW
jgi:hypothetical protein